MLKFINICLASNHQLTTITKKILLIITFFVLLPYGKLVNLMSIHLIQIYKKVVTV